LPYKRPHKQLLNHQFTFNLLTSGESTDGLHDLGGLDKGVLVHQA
jgi:hypothetical protein